MTHKLFLHGLDSSAQGTKGRWFAEHFPAMIIPDFVGSLQERMQALDTLCHNLEGLILVGSSFGGLMATLYAARQPQKCKKIILLAPALNFAEFSPPTQIISVPSQLFIGRHDTITPPAEVVPLAQRSFSNLQTTMVDDDHLLRRVFLELDWEIILSG